MTAALPHQHTVSGRKANEARTKIWEEEEGTA